MQGNSEPDVAEIDVWVSLPYIGDGRSAMMQTGECFAIAFIATKVRYEDDLLFVGENRKID